MGDLIQSSTEPSPRLTDCSAPQVDHGGADEEQAVLVTLDLGTRDGVDLSALADSVDRVILAERTGELDGLQAHGTDVTLFAYGTDAERLWASMRPAVSRFPHRSGTVTIRYGLFGASERCLPI